MPETHIHLIRHGQVHNPHQILYGRLPRFRLTARGLDQARQAADHLADLDLAAVFTSPLLRARQTAAAIVQRYPGFKPHITRYLNEVRSPYQGRPGAELDARGGDIYTDAGPGSEQPADIVRRLETFIGRILKRFPGRHIAAVTHGDVITFGVIQALGAEVIPENKTRLKALGYPTAYPAHCSVTTLIFSTTMLPALTSITEKPNVVYHLPYKG